MWGGRDETLFASVVNSTSVASNGWKNVLGMNEYVPIANNTKPISRLSRRPQDPNQSNLSPQDAANMWKTYLEPLKAAGVRLGSPATTSSPTGINWTQDFFTACAGGCTVDFIALREYNFNIMLFVFVLINRRA